MIEKKMMKDDFSKRKVFQEVYIMKKIKHSNVINLLEVFESPKHLLMIMEYVNGGDLLQFIKSRGRMKEEDAKHIFKQICYGLGHIHCRSVIHRDIKLDNILLDAEQGIKIIDFGVSKIVKKDEFEISDLSDKEKKYIDQKDKEAGIKSYDEFVRYGSGDQKYNYICTPFFYFLHIIYLSPAAEWPRRIPLFFILSTIACIFCSSISIAF